MRLSFVLSVLASLTLLGVSLLAKADPDICSSSLQADAGRARAIAFLQTAAGQYDLGGCHVELHVCQSFAASGDDHGTLVGDLLLTDQAGREFYIPLDFGGNDSHKTAVKILNGKRMFHYEFDDDLDDPVAGHHESLRLEILKDEHGGLAVTHIETGVYTTKDREARGGGAKYVWAICDAGVAQTSL